MIDLLRMTVQERLCLITFASKAAEMLEQPAALDNIVNQQQLESLALEARKVLARLDTDNPGMLPLPHDGRRWSER